jgi:hypothetical protein
MHLETTTTLPTTELQMPKRIDIEDLDRARYMFFGSFFILGVNTALFPLDTLTTIIMSDVKQLGKQKSIPCLIQKIVKTQGIFRFWRGLGPAGKLF